jgi:hypothetical protein
MKITQLGKLVLCSLALTAVGQTLPEPGPATFGYTPVESGDNYIVWSRLAWRTNDQGGLVLQTNTFVELGNLGGDWPFCCDYTWLIHGECHLSSAYFEPGVVLKFDTNSSLHIDGPLFWPADFDSGGARPLLTSANDNDPTHGEPMAWSSGHPFRGDYGPALVVRPEDLQSATNRLIVLYGEPGIVSSQAPSNVVDEARSLTPRTQESSTPATSRIPSASSRPTFTTP